LWIFFCAPVPTIDLNRWYVLFRPAPEISFYSFGTIHAEEINLPNTVQTIGRSQYEDTCFYTKPHKSNIFEIFDILDGWCQRNKNKSLELVEKEHPIDSNQFLEPERL
jgi:hypothetical protein